MTDKAYVYILECSDKTLYTGYTTDLDSRLDKHNKGLASKYTRARLPVKFVYTKEVDGKNLAMSYEKRIKFLNRKDKLRLIENPELLESLIEKKQD